MFDLVALLFVIASVLGYINYRLFKLPATIGIMIGALVGSLALVAIEVIWPESQLTNDLRGIMSRIDFAKALMHGMLGFLLFAGALHVNLDDLKERLAPILSLATVGTLLSTAIVGFGSWWLFQVLATPIPLIYCMLFGSLISPTDPVAVVGVMKRAGAPKDIEVQVIGESLFNDGIGVVVFGVLMGLTASAGHHVDVSVAGIATLLFKEVGGGVLLGLGGGLLTYFAIKKMEDPNLETLISVALVMGLSSLAFALHTSAPLACVIAGLFMGNQGRSFAMGDVTRDRLDTVWSFLDEALNICLFLLIGLEALILEFSTTTILIALICTALVLGARALGVFFPMLAFTETMREGTRRILIWGGLRGGISIALALSLPAFEGRNTILSITYIIVVISVLLQGLTLGTLIERLIPESDRPQSPDAHH